LLSYQYVTDIKNCYNKIQLIISLEGWGAAPYRVVIRNETLLKISGQQSRRKSLTSHVLGSPVPVKMFSVLARAFS
jgi:hypothetical protein